jgi:two-component system sensor histidine kinase KdpD
MPNNKDLNAELRPSPEALLASVERAQRGQLRIFLGAAPGVGKTYTMLEAAQLKKRKGVDTVVGVVETHGRPETQALLQGLETVPQRKVEYRGKALEEMDLDAILARRPQLVLVDELAHTNASGSRHPKRYLDVQELLSAGIDVFTTVNIQHFESLNDAIAQITSVRVRETLPDLFMERADEVELVDISPEELLQRMREGKVYVADQAARAIENYFRPGNLSALRQLALRKMTERVDEQMQNYMQAHAIPGPWPTVERIVVCISPSPLSARLVRAARRIAERRQCEWLAVYIETSAHYRLSEANKDRVTQTLRLAEQLGGEAVTVPGQEIARDLVRYAQSRNATAIIVGRSSRPWWYSIRYGSLIDRLIRDARNIDLYVISGNEESAKSTSGTGLGSKPAIRFEGYLLSAIAVAGAGLLAALLHSFLALPNLSLVFLTGVLFSAVIWGMGPSIFASVLSVLVYDFFFVPPIYKFTVTNPQDMLALLFYLSVAIVTSQLMARIRNQARATRQREARTSTLYALSREIAGAAKLDDLLQAVASKVAQIMRASVGILLPDPEQLNLKASYPPEIEMTETDRAPATWAWQHNQLAGQGSDTLPGAKWLCWPLATASRNAIGVLALQFDSPRAVMTPEQKRLLEALADQAVVAIERMRLMYEIQQAKIIAETEKLRSALLSSISHDLRTPLACILGAATSLTTYGSSFDEATKLELLLAIQEDAERLNRFVDNLLDMTRLESGVLQLNRQWIEVGDVIGTALARLVKPLAKHQVVVDFGPELPLLWVDYTLTEQVLVNLLDNAAKYSTEGTTIRVNAYRGNGSIYVEIIDEGIGIPPTELENVFDKFYRIRRSDRQSPGTGLGLSICRGFVEAHGGRIFAKSPGPSGKGTILTVVFPLTKEQPTVFEHQVGHE